MLIYQCVELVSPQRYPGTLIIYRTLQLETVMDKKLGKWKYDITDITFMYVMFGDKRLHGSHLNFVT